MDRYRAAASSAPPRSFLLVNFPVAPQILPFAFGDEAASWGELVSVTCSVAKGDQPLEISWAFNGTPIGSHHGSDVVIGSTNKKNSVLTIESVAASHAGEYTCSASNRAGATTHSSRLTVNGTCVIPSHVKKKKKKGKEGKPSPPSLYPFFSLPSCRSLSDLCADDEADGSAANPSLTLFFSFLSASVAQSRHRSSSSLSATIRSTRGRCCRFLARS